MNKIIIHVRQPAQLNTVTSPLSLALVGGERARERAAVPAAGRVVGQALSREPVETATRHEPGSTVGPRLCGYCHRPLLAEHRSEYTLWRAALVAERGLCMCPVALTPTETPDAGAHR